MSDAKNGTVITDSEEERYSVLQELGVGDAALERFLDKHNISVPKRSASFRKEIAMQISDETLDEIVKQHIYAGSSTINYFVITNVQSYSFDHLLKKVREHFPTKASVEGLSRKPFLAKDEIIDNRLYLTIGYFKTTGGEDILTGKKKSELTTKRCIVVIRDDSDLVEIRTSDGNIAEDIRDEVGKSIGSYKQSSIYRPNFNVRFQNKFDELVEKYTNLKVKVDESEGSTVDRISFTTREDEQGHRGDARKDNRVQEELDRPGSEITMGYVVLEEGFRFQLNRKQSKISIRREEREEQLAKITEIVDNVLKQTGGYSQRTLRGIEDVLE